MLEFILDSRKLQKDFGVVSHLQIYMKFRKMKSPTCYGKAGWGNYDRFCFHQKISDCELQWILLESVEYSA